MKLQIKISDYFYYDNHSADKKYNAPVLVITGRDSQWNYHVVPILDKNNLMCRLGVLKDEALNFGPNH